MKKYTLNLDLPNLQYTSPVLRVDDTNGQRWLIRMVRLGDRYGLDNCLIHGRPRPGTPKSSLVKTPLVEFYDFTNPKFSRDFVGEDHEEGYSNAPLLGQFVSRYYLSTLMEDRQGLLLRGLNLCGHVAKWRVSAPLLDHFMEWADRITELPPEEQPLYTEELDTYGG